MKNVKNCLISACNEKI